MSTKAQHTPGPWTCSPFLTPHWEEDPMGVYMLGEAGNDLERRFAKAESGSEELDDIHAENAANAALIAAAPDLLEALKNLVSVIAERFPDADGLGGLEEAQAAIAKATGQ